MHDNINIGNVFLSLIIQCRCLTKKATRDFWNIFSFLDDWHLVSNIHKIDICISYS